MALQFTSASTEYFTSDSFAVYNTITSALTCMAWVNQTTTSTAQTIIGRASTAIQPIWELGMATTGRVTMTVNALSTTSSTTTTAGTWHHVAATWSSSGTATLYLDGVSVGSGTVSVTNIATNTLNYAYFGSRL